MTKTLDSEPWRSLPDSVADLIEPELAAVSGEIVTAIGREVPEYARPLEGSFGRGIRTGVGEALSQFVALIRRPDAGRGLGREVYVALGRGELRQGRTLDSLQAAYRVGARVAWRRIAAAGRRAELDPEVISTLAEAIFAYIDELSADSVDGYAAAQSETEELRGRRRYELAALMMREPPAPAADLRAAAQAAGWRVPHHLAALACAESELAQIARRLPTDSLVTRIDGLGCVLLPDVEGPGRLPGVERAVAGAAAALGPVDEPGQLRQSWRLAMVALRALEAGAIGADGVIRAEDHLAELLLFEGSDLAQRIASRRLAPFEALTEKARERMRETALAYLRQRGNSVAMAADLHVHPQTARYRVARLRELLGDQLDDPDARFELEIALRAQRS
jgi:PucR C-terminal helix-turn-helix domain